MYFKECCVPKLQILAKPDPVETVKQDGSITKYYKLAVLQGQSAGMVDVSVDVFNQVELMKTYDMYFSFNSDYDKIWLLFKSAIPSK